jgi:carotenoid cleavage dioxygenase
MTTSSPHTSAPSPKSQSDQSKAEHPYARGNFAPVDRELTRTELRVRGSLPKELNGVLMRNGPNPVRPMTETHHWFVGDGMLHAIELQDGRAQSYRNRYVRTKRVQEALGLPAASTSPHEPPIQGSGAVNVIKHAGKILALGEVGLPYQLDARAETLLQYDFDGQLRSNMTAHPKLDPVTGQLYFFGYDFGEVNLRYHVADASGALTKTLELATKQPVMMHDFGLTETRAVLMDLPVVFDLNLVAKGYSMPFRWDEDYGARLGVMKRDGDGQDLRYFEIDPCYVYHLWNAYDDGKKIVMDVVEHARTFALSAMGPEDELPPRAVRWVIDPDKGSLERSVLDDSAQEFPRIDPRLVARKHRYGYSVQALWDGSLAFGGVIKHDFTRGTRELHELDGGRAASEAVFVPASASAGEDEGYVLVPIYDPSTHSSEIRVLDAQRVSAAPIATIELQARIPFGFHGDFFAS